MKESERLLVQSELPRRRRDKGSTCEGRSDTVQAKDGSDESRISERNNFYSNFL